jgi:hypothetical protein
MAERYLLLFDLDGALVRLTDTGEKDRRPGTWEAMSQLSGRTNAVQAIVSASLDKDAVADLTKDGAGLGFARYLDLEVGGYAPDSTDLAELVSVARQRAKESHGDLSVVVIAGPSVETVTRVRDQADVVVAVAIPESDPDALRAAGAKHVLTNLLELVPLVLDGRVG